MADLSSYINIKANNVVSNTVVSTSGNISGNYILGNGSQLTGITTSYSNANVTSLMSSYGSNTISTSGNVTAGNLIGNISITGNVTGTSANVQLIAGAYTWTFDNTGNLTLPTNGDLVFSANTTLGSQSGSNGNITINPDGTGQLIITSTTPAQFGNIISAAGNITGNYIFGNGSQLTGLPATYGNSNVTTLLANFGSNTISTTGNITSGNVTLSGNLTVNGSPIYGVAASYAKYTRTTQQTGTIAANTVVVCNVSENTFGSDISVNTTTGQVTLQAGRTYRLRGGVPGWTGSAGSLQWCWYNETTPGWLGESG